MNKPGIPSAIEQALKLLAVSKQAGNSTDPQAQGEIANMLAQAGIDALQSNDLAQATELFKGSLVAYAGLIDDAGQTQFQPNRTGTLANLGNAFQLAGRVVEAVALYQEALDSYARLIDEAGQTQFEPNRAQTLMNLGNALQEAGRMDDAVALYQEALIAYTRLIDCAGQSQFEHARTHTLVNLGVALLKTGRVHEAIDRYQHALEAYARLIDAGQPQLEPSRTHTLMNLGIALRRAGRVDESATLHQQALAAYARLIDEGGQARFEPNRARTQVNLGVTLKDAGRIDEAVAYFEQALGTYARLVDKAGQNQFGPDRCQTLMNLGNALQAAGRLDEAVASYQQALVAYTHLIDEAGQTQFEPDRTGTLMNLGNALQRAGQMDEAVTHYQLALTAYARLIDDAGQAQFEPNRTHTLVNLAIALGRAERVDEAVEHYQQALDAYGRLIDEADQTQLEPDRTQTFMNLGVALQRAGRKDEAVAHFQQALAAYARLIDDAGQSQFEPNRTRTLMNVGDALADSGRMGEAVTLFDEAAQRLQAIVGSGKWQYTPDCVRALRQGWQAALRNPDMNESAWLQRVNKIDQALLAIKMQPSDMSIKHRDSLVEMVQLAKLLKDFVLALPGDTRQLPVQAAVNHSLEWMAVLLRDANPVWLQSSSQIEGVVTRFRDVCMALGGAMPGNWFLATQGLRSQRAALAQSDDPELKQLNDVWQELDHVANQINGQTSLKPQSKSLFDDAGDTPLRGYSSETASAKDDLGGRWNALNKRKNALLKTATYKLPPQLNLSMPQVTQRLQALQAVVMLAPVAAGNLLVMLVTKAADTVGEKNSGKSAVGHRQWLLNVGTQRARLARTPNDATADAPARAGFEPEELLTALHNHRLGLLAPTTRESATGEALHGHAQSAATRAMRAGGVSDLPHDLQTDEARASAITDAAAYTAALQAELAGLWVHLNSVGCTTVHWVVSGPLHSLPWRQLLAGPTGSALRLKLYPHMAAWYQCNELRNPADPAQNPLPTVAQMPHWATLAYTPPAGDKDWLPFLAMEQALAVQLWAGSPQPMRHLDLAAPQWPLARADDDAAREAGAGAGAGVGTHAPVDTPADTPVNALFAAGHGDDRPADNFALAGVLTGVDAHGTKRYLQAQHLTRIKNAERIFLSCCVGAKTRHAMSEPLGLVAGAFDYRTRFAVGALVSVGDFDAMLFSLAYQWALRSAYVSRPV